MENNGGKQEKLRGGWNNLQQVASSPIQGNCGYFRTNQIVPPERGSSDDFLSGKLRF